MSSFLEELKLSELNEYQLNKRSWLLEKKYKETTALFYWRMLNSNVNKMELALGKDLYKFSKPEVESIIKNFITTSDKSKKSLFSCVSMYINWAESRGWNSTGNPCDSIDINDVLNINVLAKQASYLTLTDFYKLIDGFECSDIDRAMFILLRYGVPMEQLNSLKFKDINGTDMTIDLHTEEDGLYKLPIDEDFLIRMKLAENCQEYEFITERKNAKNPVAIKYEYINTDYVIKIKRNMDAVDNKMKTTSIYNRINQICKNEGIPRLKTGELNKSRKFDLLNDILEKNKVISMHDIKNVISVFDREITFAKTYALRDDYEIVANVKVLNENE